VCNGTLLRHAEEDAATLHCTRCRTGFVPEPMTARVVRRRRKSRRRRYRRWAIGLLVTAVWLAGLLSVVGLLWLL